LRIGSKDNSNTLQTSHTSSTLSTNLMYKFALLFLFCFFCCLFFFFITKCFVAQKAHSKNFCITKCFVAKGTHLKKKFHYKALCCPKKGYVKKMFFITKCFVCKRYTLTIFSPPITKQFVCKKEHTFFFKKKSTLQKVHTLKNNNKNKFATVATVCEFIT